MRLLRTYIDMFQESTAPTVRRSPSQRPSESAGQSSATAANPTSAMDGAQQTAPHWLADPPWGTHIMPLHSAEFAHCQSCWDFTDDGAPQPRPTHWRCRMCAVPSCIDCLTDYGGRGEHAACAACRVDLGC